MTFQIRAVTIYGKQPGQVHTVPFTPGGLNIVTGDSRRGKSALLTIIDYCLASSEYPVKSGKVRDGRGQSPGGRERWYGDGAVLAHHDPLGKLRQDLVRAETGSAGRRPLDPGTHWPPYSTPHPKTRIWDTPPRNDSDPLRPLREIWCIGAQPLRPTN
ncbi:hypothetical protein [Streptomyces candidus]|uniref:Rad50/SbcC-type AAA domain-containing protein n=1 Tax=Streptomyces candidus TaxID=67283 RepID=A0A7X0HLJ7_9ACTN|nr:hypothetical protein [Streptomyces candidus]MBB6439781.1 hypothetical protein [Streptomyces candidus]GHH56941.1 hypothetical protein GCM10018773_63600 [Streptomyces candidus]